MRVCIAGGTGFIGTHLCRVLTRRGDSVVVLTRDVARARVELGPGPELMAWAPGVEPLAPAALQGVDAIVNLAGEPVGGRRWTAEVKRRIRASRLDATRTLVEAIAAASVKPAVLVNASGAGYFGASLSDAELDETAPPGQDFLAGVCQDWERAAQLAAAHTRVAVLRIGVVLGDGGALAKMRTPFQLFVGGPIGSGRQWFSWIHVNDLAGLVCRALDDPRVRGVMNATAPGPVTMRDFTRALGRALHRPSWLPVPAFALRALFGEGADVILLGQRVVPATALALGFAFEYAQIEPALRAATT